MWAPHPRGRIIRRPQPDFSHRRSRIQRKPAPQVILDSVPDPRCNYKYFGIHRSDITDHLKIIVPSHAFHPSLVGALPPPVRGRGPCSVKGKRRPETAPASTVWFGRTCSDVSDWLRYRPPAHLGLDPDNKPLPSYPTSSSLVTDPKWQTKEFPALPNVLWHWWKERPSSVPLATKPQQVKFDTLVEALKDRVVRPSGPYTPPTSAPPTTAPTPRSRAQTPRDVVPTSNGEAHQSRAQTPQLQGAQTPRNLVATFNGEAHQSRAQTPQMEGAQTPQNVVPTSNGETHQSRAQTPQVQGAQTPRNVVPTANGETHQSRAQTPRLQGPGDQLDLKSWEEFPIRPASVSSSTFASRPSSAAHGATTNLPTSTPRGKSGPIDGSPRLSLAPRHHSAGESPRSPNPLGYGCENSRDTPRSGYGTRGVGTSALSLDVRSPQVEVQNCACDRTSPSQVPIPRLNFQATGETSLTPSKPSTPTVSCGKPPPSPRPSHPNPPHVPRQAIPRKTCGRHHAAVPSGLYVQGQGHGSSNRGVERKTPRAEIARASQGLTVDNMRRMSPDSFATKIVWAEKLKTQGQGLPWPFEEKKAIKTVKVF